MKIGMSAIGPKRTQVSALHMSAFDPKRTSISSSSLDYSRLSDILTG